MTYSLSYRSSAGAGIVPVQGLAILVAPFWVTVVLMVAFRVVLEESHKLVVQMVVQPVLIVARLVWLACLLQGG